MASETLLLVDDDETVRSGLGLVLEASGYDVTLAQGVSEALSLIASRQFDVLLTDLNMPPGPGDGLTVIAAMRQAQPQTLALLMSADPRHGRTDKGAETQPDEFFIKPVHPMAVGQRIRELLDERAGRRSAPGDRR